MRTLQEKIAEIVAKNTPTRVKFFELLNEGLTQTDAANILDIQTWTLVAPTRRTRTPRTPRRPQVQVDPLTLYSFGVEMETISPISRYDLARKIAAEVRCNAENYNHDDHADGVYKIVHDGSVRGVGESAEVVTPVLKTFETLKTVCRIVNEAGCTVNKTCGLHVHIGAADLSVEQYKNVFLNYGNLEKAIDKFMARSRRADNAYYAKSIQSRRYSVEAAVTFQGVEEAFGYVRYFKVNACAYNRHKTIEFRQHQGTTDFTKIKQWVDFCKALVEYSKTNRLENEITEINDIPFLSEAEKRYFNSRAARLA